jgi:hypothetical protein
MMDQGIIRCSVGKKTLTTNWDENQTMTTCAKVFFFLTL